MEVSIYIYIYIYLDTDLLLIACLYCDVVLDLSRFLSDIGQPDLLPVVQQAEQPVHVATTIRRAIGVPHAVADALPCPWSCRAGDGHRWWFTLCGERQAEILRDALLTPPEHFFTQPAAAPSGPQPDQASLRQTIYETVSARLRQLRIEASAAAENDNPPPPFNNEMTPSMNYINKRLRTIRSRPIS